ncbi:MAG: DUF2934 domain-containing protein [Terriglobales bacterium]
MSTDLRKKPAATGTTETQPIEHQIRLRAYQLYEARGCEGGHEVEDWLRAEEEITNNKKISTIAA